MKDEREMRWLCYVYMYVWICYLRPVFLRQSIWSTNKILKEIAVLEYENVKIF